MKKPNVLNRAMFNQGGTSAYGRGITSNLVTEEQRQRFNYGGRVRAADGLYNRDWYNEPEMTWQGDKFYPIIGLNRPKPTDEIERYLEEAEGAKTGSMEDFYSEELEKARFGQSDKYTTGPEGIGLIEKKTQEEIIPGADGAKEVMTDSDWMDLLGPTAEQKRRTKGEAQLGLAAGALDVFSQPTIAKGMKAASPHLSKLAQTASADQKARDKAILQGKVLSKVYTDRAAAKGKADIDTLQWKLDAVKKTGSPLEKFYSVMQASEEKKPKDIVNAIFEATDYKIKPEVMPNEEKSNALLADPKNEGRIFIQGKKAFQIVRGAFVPIEYEEILKVTEEV